jgi:AcrR family transcriptional regulator
MSDIASGAEVSRATVFNHFGSKQMILDAIIARSLTVYRDLLSHALTSAEGSTDEVLKGLFRRLSEGMETNRALHLALFGEIRKVPMSTEAPGLSPGLRQEAFDLLIQIFSRGQARGDVSDRHSPETFALALDSLLSGAILHWLHRTGGGPLAPILDTLATVFLEGASRHR